MSSIDTPTCLLAKKMARSVVTFLLAVLLNYDGSAVMAEDRSQWQDLMERGSIAEDAIDFKLAQSLFEQAESESKKLGVNEQLLTLLRLGALAEIQGDYSVAESIYRQGCRLPDARQCQFSLWEVVEKQKRPDEARQLRQDAPGLASFSEDDNARKCMPRIRSGLKKPWSKQLAHIYKLSDAYHNGTPGPAGWTCVFMRLDPSLPHPVGYVMIPSGSSKLDAAAMFAVENASVSDMVNKVNYAIDVDFSFSTLTSFDSEKSTPREQHTYHFLRELVSWQENRLGSHHPQVAVSLSSAANCLATSGNLEAALTAFQKAVEAWQASGVVCSGTCFTYQRYGEALLRSKKFTEAVSILRKAVNLAERFYQPDTKGMVECKTSLAKALAKSGKSSEAKELKLQINALKGPSS
jgi:tetratricopeptide (TPR) repeat protein